MTIREKMLAKTESDFIYNISIIVPVYNAEDTIQATLESLINQTLSNIEIICVNDGSTDYSPELLSQLQSEYPSLIKVLTIPNQGVYKARTWGIENARGKYVGFCDSDDTVEPTMFEKLFTKAEEEAADLTICAYWRQDKNKILSTEMQHPELSCLDINNSSGWLVSINTAVWNKLIRTNLAKQCIKLHQPPKITEDALFLLSLYPYASKIAFINEPLYHYFANNSTAMKSITRKETSTIIASWKETRSNLIQENCAYIPIIDLAAFIHLGLSLPLIMVKTHSSELKQFLSDISKILETEFNTFRHCKFLKVSYVIKHRTWMTLPFFASILYRLHLLSPALKAYALLTSIIGRDLKW